MSYTKPKKKGHSQTHQNTEKWRHNPNSVMTKKILSLEHYCLCYRCEAQIEWRKTYRKYKPLKAMRRCNGCLGHEINRAYHTFCDKCATDRGICAKCGKTYDTTGKQKPVSDDEMLDALKHADIKERFKRTILRNWERGLFINDDIIKIINLILDGEHVVWEDWIVDQDEEDDDKNPFAAPKASKGALALAARQKLDLTELLPEDMDKKQTLVTTLPVVEGAAAATTTTTTTTTTPSTTSPESNTSTTTTQPTITETTTQSTTTTTTATPTPTTAEAQQEKKKITILPKQTTSRIGAMSTAIPGANKKK